MVLKPGTGIGTGMQGGVGAYCVGGLIFQLAKDINADSRRPAPRRSEVLSLQACQHLP